jgi:hypothetical protein
MTPRSLIGVHYEDELVMLRPGRDFLAPEHQIVRENPLDFDAVAPRLASRRSAEVRAYTVSGGRLRLMNETKIEERS